ncbi:hypothetical protein [Actinocorallia aurantiaca]|uniref:hypothetical protein n=1 Tax=Actinocorallia aurantiaca TaxID=46204 RepID=UPI0031D61806
MSLGQNGTVGRALVAGLCGGAATLAGGVAAVAVYLVVYGVETSFTYEAPGGDMDFTGFASFFSALPSGILAFPVAGWLLLRRFGFSPVADIQIPAASATFLACWAAFISPIGDLVIEGRTGVLLSAVFACVVGGLCYAVAAIAVDRRGHLLWQLIAGGLLLATAVPVLREVVSGWSAEAAIHASEGPPTCILFRRCSVRPGRTLESEYRSGKLFPHVRASMEGRRTGRGPAGRRSSPSSRAPGSPGDRWLTPDQLRGLLNRGRAQAGHIAVRSSGKRSLTAEASTPGQN